MLLLLCKQRASWRMVDIFKKDSIGENMKKIIFFMLIILLASSCKESSHKGDPDSESGAIDHSNHAGHLGHSAHGDNGDNGDNDHSAHGNHDHGLSLDNGKKWKADPETNRGMKRMDHLVDSFSQKETGAAYHNIKSNLEAELNRVFKECTMKGEAHHQLHKFLIPIKKIFTGLEHSQLAVQKKSFHNLKMHLSIYPKYFE